MIVVEKNCSRCKTSQPTSNFHKNKTRKDGLSTWCKTCSTQATNEYRQTENGRFAARKASEVYLEKNRESSRKYTANLNAFRKSNGICVNCGKESAREGKLTCQSCVPVRSQYTANMRKKRVDLGLCVLCGKHPFMDSEKQKTDKKCESCYFKSVARGALGDSRYADALREKFLQQNSTCPYTGSILVLGANAVVDHKLPRAHYPHLANDINNVEWVRDDVNLFKRDLSPDKFLELVKHIYHYTNQ